jgi:ketosteroid isomerase-like protein
MADGEAAERARRPEDLDRLFLERANAGDVDGVVALYEPQAVLAFPPGQLAIGTAAIRDVYAGLLAPAGDQVPLITLSAGRRAERR